MIFINPKNYPHIFRCLKRLQVKKPSFAAEIIKACLVVHNFRGPDNYIDQIDVDYNDFNDNDVYEEINNGDRQAGLNRLNAVVQLFTV